jgi:glycosyltransferase involved in cell wall biosynthesis
MADMNLRVAIVHDWLIGGGAERVVHELHKMFPDAPIYTSYCSDEWRTKLDGKVVTGFLQRWPFSRLRKFLPVLRIWWFTRLDFSGFDLVISSSGNGEAKGVRVPEGTTHICYCHTPTHFYWRHYERYLARPGFGALDPLVRVGLRLLVGPLRAWDLKASKRPDYYIANSNHIKDDIKKYYGRDAVVVHPPVDTARFDVPEPPAREGFVMASRQVPQKRFDLAISACNVLGLPLSVVGKGPEHARLVAMGGPKTTFVENVSDEDMPALLARGRAFIFPSFEDFGVIPVEALAAGTPVIALRAGGALDYVKEGETGLFIEEQTVEALIATLKKFDSYTFNPQAIKRSAQVFSEAAFAKNMQKVVDDYLAQNRPQSVESATTNN